MPLYEFLTKHSRAISATAGLIVIGGFAYGIFKLFFESADLEVIVTVNDANLPTSIASKYSSSMNWFVDRFPKKEVSQDVKKALSDVLEVSSFLTETNSKATFEIDNNSNKTLKNIDIRIKNVSKLTAWGVTGNSLQTIEATEIMRAMRTDPQNGIITFGGIEKIPPQSSLIITIWGETRQYLIDDPISVTYDGGSGKVVRTSTVRGFASFIYENTTYLLILLALVNIGAFFAVIDAVSKKMKKVQQSEQAAAPS